VEILGRVFSRFCFLAFLLLELRAAEGLGPASREYQVKAVCLWRLAQYVQWPTNTFASTNSPIVIAVLGENPFGNALQLAVQNEKAQGHPLRVEYFDRVQEALGAHILFISRNESRHVLDDIAALDHRSILTVSDIDNFVRDDHGMVRIYIDQGKLRLRASPEAAAASRLTIDARLLRIAEIER